MRFAAVRAMPKEITVDGDDPTVVRDSELRSYHIIGKVQELLRHGDAPETILEIIRDLQDA